jgi:hypothetical protein
MKRAFFILLIMSIVLVSCTKKQELLYYQRDGLFVECTLNGEYKISIEKLSSEYKICFISPAELSSISFHISDEPYAISEDGVKIPLPSDKIAGIYALCGVLELDEELITSATPADDGCAIYSFLKNDILYEITYSKSSLPLYAKITSDTLHYEIKFDAIRLPQ